MNFSQKLQALRCAAGLSPEQLAAQPGIPCQTLDAWERGDALPDLEQTARISQRFGVSADYLVFSVQSCAAPVRLRPSPHRLVIRILTGVSALLLFFVWVLSRIFPAHYVVSTDTFDHVYGGYAGFVMAHDLSLLTRPCWFVRIARAGLLLYRRVKGCFPWA